MGKRRFTITMNAQRVLNSSITSAAALLRQSSPVTRIAAAGGLSTSGEWGGVYVDRHNSTNSWSAQWATSPQQQQALGSVREMSQQELMDSYISSLRGYQTPHPAERFAFNETPNCESIRWARRGDRL